VYSGSARNGLTQRIGRHLRHRKRKHWHVDYLLAWADKVEVFVSPGLTQSECELHANLPAGGVPVLRFGCSDCRCASHLTYFHRRPEIRLTCWSKFLASGQLAPSANGG
jgi:sugar fermentation stimulation protein A